jgi:membrane-associated phospholipid phosphatase
MRLAYPARVFPSREEPRRLRPMPTWLRARSQRKRARNPLIRALGDADQAVLRVLRTRAHQAPVEAVMKTFGTIGEFGAVWAAIGGAGALSDRERRRRWTIAALVGPAAINVNYAVKVAVGRERPLIEGHPPLARAPSKLSFPSAHATSSLAAATALGRVEPRSRVPLFALAGAICLSRPYLGMHYPSDVLAGAALGIVLGSLTPGVSAPPTEERLIDLVNEAHGTGAPPPASNGAPPPTGATAEPPSPAA